MNDALTEMLTDGLYLMVMGMGFVLGFLTLVVLALSLLAKLTPSEQSTTEQHVSAQVTDKTLLAVMSAAIHQFRQDNQK